MKSLNFFDFTFASTLVLGLALPIAAAAQRDETEAVRAPEMTETHAAEQAAWFENFTNPTHDPDILVHRLKGIEQFNRMSNAPAMKVTSSSAWVLAGTSQDQNVSGRGQCLAIDPNGVIYYGPPLSGLWRSADKGNTWTPLSASWTTQTIGGVAVDPVHTNIVYAGTGCPLGYLFGSGNVGGVGVYKSIDNGLNWTLSWSNIGLVTSQMLVNPANTNIVYLACTSGVLRSTDAGTTFAAVCPLGGVTSMVIDPVDPSVLYAAGGNKVQKSIDSGKTWKALSGFKSGVTMTIAMTPKNHSYIYLSSASDGAGLCGSSTLSRSIDAGATWSIISFGKHVSNPNNPNPNCDNDSGVVYLGRQGGYANALAVNPNNADEAIAGGLDIYSISGGGSNVQKLTGWTKPSSDGGFTHADIHGIYYFNNILYTFSDGGLFYSGDNGQSWKHDLNTNLATMQFVGGDAIVENGKPSFFVAGAQDNGFNKLIPGQPFWHQMVGGDGGYAYISQNDHNIMYGTYINNDIYKTVNGGKDWSPNVLANSVVKGAQFYMPYEMATDDDNVVAMCGQGTLGSDLFLTTDGFASTPSGITAIAGRDSPFHTTGSASCVTFWDGDSHNIYFGTTSTMYYSPDRGASWTKTSTNLGASVTALAVDPNNSNVVYMSVTGSKHMMVSRDAGLNFIKPDTNLPPLNYSSVATSGDFVFVGNDVGVLYSPDTGITWFPLSAGYALPSALIMKLKVRGNYLIATTYGRGMYYIDVSHLPKDGNGVAAGFAPSSASISSIYPNPVVGTSTKATVTFSVMEDARTTIGVYDVLGREEKALFNQWAGKGEHSTTVDLSNIPAGQHYIMLTAAGTSITKPITVE